MVQVAVVEDNQLLLQIISDVIKSDPYLMLVGSFTSAEEFLFFFEKNDVEIVLMDIGLPGMSGLEAIRAGKKLHPATHFIVFTLYEDTDKIFEALSSGATGYVLKGTDPSPILVCIHETLAGGSPMSSSIARKMVDILRQKNVLPDILSQREQEVILGLKDGLSYQQISEKHQISIHTVRTYIRSIYEKFQVHSRTEVLNKIFKS